MKKKTLLMLVDIYAILVILMGIWEIFTDKKLDGFVLIVVASLLVLRRVKNA